MPYKILIAVENEVYRKSICALLRSAEGLQICGEAISGAEAVEKSNRCRPDLVILDSRLTVVNALDAARQIRAGRERTAILIFSGRRTSKPYVAKVIRSGAQGCLTRDEISSLLVTAVEAIRRGEIYVSPVVASSGRSGRPGAAPDSMDGKQLTPREIEVLQLISNGSKNREAAEALHVSIKTIESHRMSIRRKLGVESVVDLVRYAIRLNLALP